MIFRKEAGRLSMTQEERLLAIVEHLKKYSKISIEEICEYFGVSRDTARRDLVKLEQDRLIIRVRGGAMRPMLANDVLRYEDRVENQEAKRSIGRRGASLIQDGNHVIFDTSTTIQYAAEAVYARNLVVVTNSIDIAHTLGHHNDITVYLLGGQWNAWQRNITGEQTIEMLRQYRVDLLFLGACGLTPEGLTSSQVDEAFVKREMIRRADKVIVLADASKFGKTLFHYVCSLDEINVIVTDQEPEGLLKDALEEHGVQIIITGGERSS